MNWKFYIGLFFVAFATGQVSILLWSIFAEYCWPKKENPAEETGFKKLYRLPTKK